MNNDYDIDTMAIKKVKHSMISGTKKFSRGMCAILRIIFNFIWNKKLVVIPSIIVFLLIEAVFPGISTSFAIIISIILGLVIGAKIINR